MSAIAIQRDEEQEGVDGEWDRKEIFKSCCSAQSRIELSNSTLTTHNRECRPRTQDSTTSPLLPSHTWASPWPSVSCAAAAMFPAGTLCLSLRLLLTPWRACCNCPILLPTVCKLGGTERWTVVRDSSRNCDSIWNKPGNTRSSNQRNSAQK